MRELRVILLIPPCFVTALLPGCSKPQTEASAVKVLGGEAASTQHPEVVHLKLPSGNPCTGTFISPKKVLTAAHCMKDLGNGSIDSYYFYPENNPGIAVYLEGSEFFASQYVIHPQYPKSPAFTCLNNRDVAILTVPDANATSIANLASASPQINETITIVGFGYTDFDQTNGQSGNRNFRKFQGRNQVSQYDSTSSSCQHPNTGANTGQADLTDMIVFEGEATTRFEGSHVDNAVSGSGDFGGPLFDSAGYLAGSTSGGGLLGSVLRSTYVNLNDSEVKSFIMQFIDVPSPTIDEETPSTEEVQDEAEEDSASSDQARVPQNFKVTIKRNLK